MSTQFHVESKSSVILGISVNKQDLDSLGNQMRQPVLDELGADF